MILCIAPESAHTAITLNFSEKNFINSQLTKNEISPAGAEYVSCENPPNTADRISFAISTINASGMEYPIRQSIMKIFASPSFAPGTGSDGKSDSKENAISDKPVNKAIIAVFLPLVSAIFTPLRAHSRHLRSAR